MPEAGPPPAPRSLRWRLLAATFAAQTVALALAGLAIAALFQEQVQRQFDAALVSQLDQVTSRLEIGPDDRPFVADTGLSDPRWTRPHSGLYWQIDKADLPAQAGVLRSRSLWDTVIVAPTDALAAGALHLHDARGPAGEPLRVAERTVGLSGPGTPTAWRLLVAADTRETGADIARFHSVLAASLLTLLVLLGGAGALQVKVGLQPLGALRRTLHDLQEGRSTRLEGRFPSEVQPLVEDFNSVLGRQAAWVERSRAQAGNLAHAVKTPLAVLSQAASEALATPPRDAGPLARLVGGQIEAVLRQIDWHLARSRAAAAHGTVGLRCDVQPVAEGLLRVLQRVHGRDTGPTVVLTVEPGLAFAGEEQDLQEMLGNLLENAFRFASGRLEVGAQAADPSDGPKLIVSVDDDGPGIDPARRAQALTRGQRLDESTPGSGLGLDIVQELARLYGGTLVLDHSPLGGLHAALKLPRALSPVSPSALTAPSAPRPGTPPAPAAPN